MAAQLGIGVNSRIFIKQTVNIGQHNQQIGFNDFRHDCRQTVVIAKLGGMVHLIHADRVVLIDNRDDADGKQGFKSIGNVCQTFRIFDHITRQQDLRYRHPIMGKNLRVKAHHGHLADAGNSLLLRHFRRTFFHVEDIQPKAHRAGRHQHNFFVLTDQAGNDKGQLVDFCQIDFAVWQHQRTGSNLNDNAFYCFKISFHYSPLLSIFMIACGIISAKRIHIITAKQ